LQQDALRLRSQYSDLTSQFTGFANPATESITSPNNPSLSADFAAAQSLPSKGPQSSFKRTSPSPTPTPKSVRFRDNPAEDEELAANRAALFPYRDDPPESNIPDQSNMTNQQIHAYHAQVLQEQDEHLDRLGESIGRQRDLSIQIGDELEEQIAMLDDVEDHVDRHQGRLDGARDRIGKIARKANDNKQITTIVVLIIILVLLIIITK
jgi:syntaxin 8